VIKLLERRKDYIFEASLNFCGIEQLIESDLKLALNFVPDAVAFAIILRVQIHDKHFILMIKEKILF
jgi:hypothetical protein